MPPKNASKQQKKKKQQKKNSSNQMTPKGKNLQPKAPKGVSAGITYAPAALQGKRRTYFQIHGSNRKEPGAITIRGCDYIQSLTYGTSTPLQGTVLANILLSPTGTVFSGTRLTQFSNLYEKYVFRRFVLHFQPSQSTSASGSILIAFDRDVTDPTPPVSAYGIKQYMSMPGSAVTSMWAPCTSPVDLSDPQDFYYTSQELNVGDIRLSMQGQIYMVVMDPPAGTVTSTTTIGSLWIEYEIDLFDPQLETAERDAVATGISGASGTTSSVQYQGYNPMQPLLGNIPMQVINGINGYLLPGGQAYAILERVRGLTGSLQILPPTLLNMQSLAPMNNQSKLVASIDDSGPQSQTAFNYSKVVVPSGVNGFLVGNKSANISYTGGDQISITRISPAAFAAEIGI